MSNDALIERLEGATADEQRELLIAAYGAIHGLNPCLEDGLPTQEGAHRFLAMLDAEAYESAALTLVPAHCSCAVYVHSDGKGGAEVSAMFGQRAADAPTPALAICIASLKARAGGEG